MNVNNLEVWLIDQFEYNLDSFILNDFAHAVSLETIVEANVNNKPSVAIRSFNVNKLINADPVWNVFKDDTPFVIFVDTERDIALHKTRFNRENINGIAKRAGNIFSKYSYNESIGEYLNEFSVPVPRVLFRDENTGLLAIAQNTFSSLPGQILNFIPKPVWGIKTIACTVGAVTVRNPFMKIILGLGAAFSGNQYLKK